MSEIMSKILLLGDRSEVLYHNMDEMKPLINVLEEHYEVVVSEDYPEITKNSLVGIDLILNYIDNWQNRGNEKVEGVLCDYLLEGGRILTVHSGILITSASKLLALHGASFNGHEDYDLLTFKRLGDSHYITKDMNSFSIYDEPYEFEFMSDRKVDIIMEFEFKGKTYPAGWTVEEGAGKLAYLAFGHDSKTFAQKPVQEIIKRSIDWLLQ